MSGWDQNISEGFQTAHGALPLHTWSSAIDTPSVEIGFCDAFPEATLADKILEDHAFQARWAQEQQDLHELKVRENYANPNGEKFGPHGVWTNKIDLIADRGVHGVISAIPTVAGLIVDGIDNLPSLASHIPLLRTVVSDIDNFSGNDVGYASKWSNWTADQVNEALDYFRGENRQPVAVSKTDEWVAGGTEGFYGLVGFGGVVKGGMGLLKTFGMSTKAAAITTTVAFAPAGATEISAAIHDPHGKWDAYWRDVGEAQLRTLEIREEIINKFDTNENTALPTRTIPSLNN